MSTPEAIGSFGLLAALFLSLLVFRRARRHTNDFSQTAAFKERLPQWVKQFEAFVFCAFMVASVIGVSWLALHFGFATHGSPRSITGTVAIYFALGICLISLPIAALGANLLSWLVPPLRGANSQAMGGLQVTFWSMNRGLLYFAAIAVPIGVVFLALASVSPWKV